MSWINTFELMCYLLTVMLLITLIRKKDYDSIFTFLSAALVGFIMELAAVKATGIYHYSQSFWFSLGFVPDQFPFFGGLMWGGLTVCAYKLVKKLNLNKIYTALLCGFLIVTMDIFLDVVAIRLDGGFWVWEGREINYLINQHTFMSVIWVNFVGYMIEVPSVVLLTYKKKEKEGNNFKWMWLISLGAILITSLGSLIALGLNYLTDDWFSCIFFSLLWVFVLIVLTKNIKGLKININAEGIMLAVFWSGMYLYCVIALIYLQVMVWFIIFSVLCWIMTLYLCLADEKTS